jgi:hypothetical protein
MHVELPVISASPLPALYGAWLDELLDGPVPWETRATCDDCAMCSKDSPDGSEEFFNPHVKCCSFHPTLANFLVGHIWNDADPQGRATIEARLRQRVAVTPLGLEMPPAYRLLFEHKGNGFGRSRALICPHFVDADGGRCAIWRHRPASCATWFCKHERGAVGERFWNAVHQMLGAVEHSLARWCLLELDIGAAALQLLAPPPPRGTTRAIDSKALDASVDPLVYRRLWGRWLGRELEYYQACADRVARLDWPAVQGIGGSEVGLYARLVHQAYQEHGNNDLPEALRVEPMVVKQMTSDMVHIGTYCGTDPLALPRALFDVLPCFDGRPTVVVLTALAVDKGIRLHENLVRKLVDFEILVSCVPST